MKGHLYKLISGIWLKMGRLWQYTGEYFWAGVEIYFYYFPTKRKQHDKPEKHNVVVFSISKRFFCFVLGNICKFGVNAIIKRCSETLEYTESSEVSCHSLVLWHDSLAVPSQIHPVTLLPCAYLHPARCALLLLNALAPWLSPWLFRYGYFPVDVYMITAKLLTVK